MTEDSIFKRILTTGLFVLFATIAFGLVWFFFLGPSIPVGIGWYLFSFAAGLSMIVLPCTLPLAFVIVPLSMGKGAFKGFMIALFFGIGVAVTLSLYGVFAAVLGKVAIGTLGAPLEVVKNWLYFVAGIFAYLFALGELGLINFRMPTYSGALPGFIQRQQDVLKALLLGLFLGNIGVGCPHPATPMILTRIAVSGDVFYGWLLFLVHAIGRVLPLIFLAILGIVGVNLLSGLVARKEKIERATGWAMVFIASFILVLGLFSHDWWVISGQHTFLESVTQEETFLNFLGAKFGTGNAHAHGLPPAQQTGLFGLPLAWGTGALLFLWILPLWWHWNRKRKAIEVLPDAERPGAAQSLRSLFWNFVTFSVLLIAIFGYLLPQRFLNQAGTHIMTPEQMQGMPDMGGGAHAHGGALYHEESDVKEGIAVNLNIPSSGVYTGTSTTLGFFVNLKPGNIPVPESEIEIQHEKKMHVIGVRKDLNDFFHVHYPELPVSSSLPQATSSLLGIAEQEQSPILITHVFNRPGDYKIWSEVKYQGASHVFGHPLVSVSGEGTTSDFQKEVTTTKIVQNYQVAVHYSDLYPGSNQIHFTIKNADGLDVPLESYLAAQMHLAVISENLVDFIHAHPLPAADQSVSMNNALLLADAGHAMSSASCPANGVCFDVAFPRTGSYKLFAQFRPTGMNLPPDEALVTPFWVEVKEAPVLSLENSWWLRLIVSLVLIAALSWGVKKYITVQ